MDDISFSFQSGNVFGFVGPNGAGKTTTLRIFATLDDPTSGDVFIDGISVREEPETIRKLVGFVPDSLPAHSDITVHEYLDFFARAYGLKGAQRREAVKGVKEFTNLAGIDGKLLKALSKGMKQRVSLGRALIHDPDVLIMDEPAAGLDPRARVEFRELVALLAELGKAILISSHILTELTEICDGVVIIERGKLLETGTIENVLAKSVPHQSLAMRTIDGRDQLCKDLLEMPLVIDVREAGKDLHVDVGGVDNDCCNLLAELVAKGHRIVEFRRLQDDLEDIFMRVTKGELQ